MPMNREAAIAPAQESGRDEVLLLQLPSMTQNLEKFGIDKHNFKRVDQEHRSRCDSQLRAQQEMDHG
jgi:hypothetical protein